MGLLEIDAADVSWATGWTIFKWRLGALTQEPVRSIQVVVVGADGKVIRESGSVGYDKVLNQDKHVAIAFKKEESSVSVRLRYGGSSVSSKLDGYFAGSDWGTSGNFGLAGDLVAVATNSNPVPSTTEALLKRPGNKLCLRLMTDAPTGAVRQAEGEGQE